MKKILLPAFLLAASLSFGQDFIVTPEGMRTKEGNQNYVTIDAPGKTSEQLFEIAYKFANTDLKKTTEAYFKDIDANHRSIYLDVSADKALIWSFPMGVKVTYDISYFVKIEFSEGQAKIIVENVKLPSDDNRVQKQVVSFSAFYNKKGELKEKEEKEQVERHFDWVSDLSYKMKS